MTVIAFPLLLDRHIGAYAAIETSARAIMANPVPMLSRKNFARPDEGRALKFPAHVRPGG